MSLQSMLVTTSRREADDAAPASKGGTASTKTGSSLAVVKSTTATLSALTPADEEREGEEERERVASGVELKADGERERAAAKCGLGTAADAADKVSRGVGVGVATLVNPTPGGPCPVGDASVANPAVKSRSWQSRQLQVCCCDDKEDNDGKQ